MKSFVAFMKKEVLETVRSGRLLILAAVFFLFGLMNPAIAKLTPWLLEVMSESMAESGMSVTAVTVDALTSWTQFYKNIPMALIVFVLLSAGSFVREYESGALILLLTKGFPRYKVVFAKTLTLLTLWTAGYFLCYGITYLYNAYYWDNAIAHNLLFSVVLWWLFGILVIGLLVLFSALLKGYGLILLLTGGSVLAMYLIGCLPHVGDWSPAVLMNSGS